MTNTELDEILHQHRKELADVMNIRVKHNMDNEWFASQVLRADDLTKQAINRLITQEKLNELKWAHSQESYPIYVNIEKRIKELEKELNK